MTTPLAQRIKIGLAIALTATVSTLTLASAVNLASTLRSHLQAHQERVQSLLLAEARMALDAGNVLDCISTAIMIQPTPTLLRDLKAVLNQCQTRQAAPILDAAQALAQQNHLAMAIATVHPLLQGPRGAEARHWIRVWSEGILTAAHQVYAQPGDRVQDAIHMVRTIPEYSPLYAAAQQQIQQWQTESATNHHLYQTATQALASGDLRRAQAAIAQFSSHPHWQAQAAILHQDLQTQQQQETYWQWVRQIEWFIAAGEPDNATRLIQALPLEYPWAERRTKLLERADVKRRQVRACRIITLRLLPCR